MTVKIDRIMIDIDGEICTVTHQQARELFLALLQLFYVAPTTEGEGIIKIESTSGPGTSEPQP